MCWVTQGTQAWGGVLTTFLEEETEAQGGPKTLGSSLLVRVKPGP